ncbi:MAG TPA: bifunctional homocysteine S-methyltransferase/methylenetetrahydrofolate reductase [Thermoanaerobaculia bacterium]|nr:bifunctional homocysteine S-methyltransferase/methylenetetrahydrofolate reductase [Thermoanaerobaculia bacterium]
MAVNFRQALEHDVLLADGAIGTLLVTRGAEPSTAKSSLCLSAPDAVSEVHDDYVDAGARILTTNTWDANRVKLREHDWADSLEKINRAAVALAREAGAGEHIFVAGSVGPLGAMVKPYGSLALSQVREIFEEQIRILVEEGVDLLLLESFSNLLEAAEAVRAARGLSADIPIVAQMTFYADGRTAFGERAGDALRTLVAAGADAAGINCTLGPQETLDVFGQIASQVGAPLSVMPNAGYPTLIRGRNVYNASPDYFREYALEFVDHGAAIVGGCCGTTPEHVRAMARALSGAARRPLATAVEAVRESYPHAVVGETIETSHFKRKLASTSFAVTVEVEPPRGADCRSSIEAARLLRGLGVDAVNVTDNPMARLRMSSVAVAGLIQRETGLDAIVQFTTRDRNVLGIQSDLLGASALGLKALLCLGGDPLKIGDYPDGHQVSEVDTLGLLRIAKILNAGADLVGNPIGAPTSFAIGCAANPAARDLEVEFSKLRAKIEAGATFAQTQPVFDPAALETFFARPDARAIPVLVGLIPLKSLKQTLYFANEVPGMVVPEETIARMRRAAERGPEFEAEEGLAIARELAAAIAAVAPGMHVMPMQKYASVATILEAVPAAARRAAAAEGPS